VTLSTISIAAGHLSGNDDYGARLIACMEITSVTGLATVYTDRKLRAHISIENLFPI
jgi:hypothetical protein